MPFKRKPEFWEPDDFQDYFKGAGGIPSPYQPPDLDVAALQEQMIAPARREYRREVPRFEARLAKRKMGRSGDYVREELDELRKYLTGIGGPSADIALRAEELKQRGLLSWAQLGISEKELRSKEEMFYSEQQRYSEQFNREYTLKDTVAAWEHEEELKRQGLTQQEIDNAMTRFDQELQFEEVKLSQQDRQFEQQLELQWAEQGLNEQEVADKKEMFYSEQERLSTQFNREYTLRETEAAWRHEEELSRQGLTQQEIDNEMGRFDQQLEWEKDHYKMVLTEEQRQFNDEMANTIRETDLSFDQLKETIRQFDDNMKRLKDLDAFEMEMREDEREMEWWQARKAAELKEIELSYISNEIFGYWDEGYAPGDRGFFTGDKYEWDEENQVWKNTPEWDKYMLDHYHMGQLDLRKYGLDIQAMLGMVGVIRGEEEGEEPQIPDTTQVSWPAHFTDQDKNSFVQEHPWATPEIMNEFYSSPSNHGWQNWHYDTFVQRFLIWAEEAEYPGGGA